MFFPGHIHLHGHRCREVKIPRIVVLPSKYNEVTQEPDIEAKGKGKNTITDHGIYSSIRGKERHEAGERQ